jgi:membrane carboxypeptidase/penicillin-binding protein PbpC
MAAAVGCRHCHADRLFPPNLQRLDCQSIGARSLGNLLQAFTAADGAWLKPVSIDEVDPAIPDAVALRRSSH